MIATYALPLYAGTIDMLKLISEYVGASVVGVSVVGDSVVGVSFVGLFKVVVSVVTS